MLFSMVFLTGNFTIDSFFAAISLSTVFFLLKMPGVGVKMGGCRLGKKKDFSHIHIFQTNIHMYKTKHALQQ